jgi:hypothetical protein
MNDDDTASVRCPMCEKKECQKHLLARFDASGDEGEYGVGLVGGPLYYEYEIEEVLERARFAWVQSVRVTGSPKAPRWIMAEAGLLGYFKTLGPSGGSVDFLDKYKSDEEAATYLPEETDFEWQHAREDFLWEVLSEYGYLRRTEEEFSVQFTTTKYLSWWADKPRDIVKKFRTKLRSVLLAAGVKLTKRKSFAAWEEEQIKRLAEGTVRLIEKKARETTGADASKPPTGTPKSRGAKKPSRKRASKRNRARERRGELAEPGPAAAVT